MMGENVKPIIECTLRRNMNQEQFPEANNKKTNKRILPNEKLVLQQHLSDLCLRMYENGILMVEIKRTETKRKGFLLDLSARGGCVFS